MLVYKFTMTNLASVLPHVLRHRIWKKCIKNVFSINFSYNCPLEPAVGFEISEKMLVILLCNNKLVHLDAKGMAILTENLCRIKCVYSMCLEKRELALKFRKTINNTQKTFRSLWDYKSKNFWHSCSLFRLRTDM